jgi:flagellar hook-associated protein 1 FlgK
LQSGFAVDIGGLSAGNSIKIGYTDSLTNTPHTITLMRVDDPSALPLADTATADANDKVVGINFSGGMSSVVAQINSALAASGMSASNPSGTTLQILDDGAGNIVNVNSLSATTTTTGLSGGGGELPFFVDGTAPYTGAITAAGSQSVGFAGRISVNSALIADPTKLVAYAAGISAGDSTRPNFMYQQLTAAQMTFSPDTGVGGAPDPFSGSITTFLRQAMTQQADAANAADNLKQGQDVVLNSLQQRFDDTSSVNIDQEMTNLLSLQNAYAANARVMSTVKNMFDILTQMM